MSQSDDLDMALDGYEPDSGYYRRQAIAPEAEEEMEAPVRRKPERTRRQRAAEPAEPAAEQKPEAEAKPQASESADRRLPSLMG